MYDGVTVSCSYITVTLEDLSLLTAQCSDWLQINFAIKAIGKNPDHTAVYLSLAEHRLLACL